MIYSYQQSELYRFDSKGILNTKTEFTKSFSIKVTSGEWQNTKQKYDIFSLYHHILKVYKCVQYLHG